MSIMPLQFALAISVDNMFGSRLLIDVLSKFGFAIGYNEVVRFKQSVVQHEGIGNVLSDLEDSFIQFVGDNTDMI